MTLPLDCVHIIHSYLPFETCIEVCDTCAEQQYKPWYTCTWAVKKKNSRSTLQWLHAHDHCTCTDKTVKEAIPRVPLEVLQYLLEEKPTLIRPAVFYKAIQYGRLDIVTWLNSDYNFHNLFTVDMYHVAYKKCNWEILEYLLRNRLEPVPGSLVSKLAYYFRHGPFDLITLRVELIFEALELAIGRLDVSTIKVLRRRLDPDQPLRMPLGWTREDPRLHSTVMKGFPKIWEHCLARLAINDELNWMSRALKETSSLECLEALRCSPEVIATVLSHPTKPPSKISLQCGAQHGDLKMVQYVCAHRTVPLSELRSAIGTATTNGHMHVAGWLSFQTWCTIS
jgi:hypothetical protein